MRDVVSAIFFTALGLFYLISSLQYETGYLGNPGSGFFPRMIGFITLCCSVVYLVISLRKRKTEKINILWEGIEIRRVLFAGIALGSVVVYLLVIDYVGFLVASSILIFFLAWMMGGNNWVYNVTLGIVSSGLMYWFFWMIMRVPIPLGSLWER